jgi:hypothetical protein
MSESVGANKYDRGQTMVSKSLVSGNDKSSEPEIEGNIRTLVWDSASARKAAEGEDVQMSPGDLTASLREVGTPTPFINSGDLGYVFQFTLSCAS